MSDDPKEKEKLKEQLQRLVSLQQIDDGIHELKKSLEIIPGQIESVRLVLRTVIKMY